MADNGDLLARLGDPAVRRDPHPLFNELRERGSVLEVGDAIRVVTTADAAHAVLADPRRFGSDLRNATLVLPDSEDVEPDLMARYSTSMMIFTDPPQHDRLRGLVQQTFAPKRVNAMRPYLEGFVGELLDAAQERGSMDVIEDLALPLPVGVICHLMGIPDSDRGRIHEWADILSAQLDNVAQTDVEQRRRAVAALEEYSDYLRAQIARRADAPGDDILSELAGSGELTEEEMLATCVLLLGAGHETTVGLIGNGTVAFLRNPDQWDRLRAEPDLIRPAVEECFRYDGPVRLTYRAAREDTHLDDVEIPKGALVVVLIAAANRDPLRYDDPDTFDIGRKGPANIGSGFGIHWCLGGVLSRLEAAVAFGALAQRWERLAPQLDLDTIEMRDAMMICRPQHLPVAVPAGA